MGVVQQPVDGRSGQGLGHELVEPGGVKVRGDRHRAFLVGGVDQPVEAFGGVGRHRQQADIVNDNQLGAEDFADRFADGVVGAVPADQPAEVFQGEPGDVQSLFDGELPERLEQERLPGSGRSADDEVLSGSRGTLLCPGPLRTGRARFPGIRLKQTPWATEGSASASLLVCCLGGGEPLVAAGVKKPVDGPVLAIGPLDDVLLAQDPSNGDEPLLPLERGPRFVIGIQQELPARMTATALGS